MLAIGLDGPSIGVPYDCSTESSGRNTPSSSPFGGFTLDGHGVADRSEATKSVEGLDIDGEANTTDGGRTQLDRWPQPRPIDWESEPEGWKPVERSRNEQHSEESENHLYGETGRITELPQRETGLVTRVDDDLLDRYVRVDRLGRLVDPRDARLRGFDVVDGLRTPLLKIEASPLSAMSPPIGSVRVQSMSGPSALFGEDRAPLPSRRGTMSGHARHPGTTVSPEPVRLLDDSERK